MKFLVQKYGGTSVGSLERIRHVAARAIQAKRDGNAVVLVVSAMAGETNRLLDLCSQLCPKLSLTSASTPNRAERDVVAATGELVAAALTSLAIQSMGEKSRSFTGSQLPIETDSSFGNGNISGVNIKPVLAALENGEIPVIAGFQGVDPSGRLTTLGRGGSDTTAVAVAAALNSAPCEIYTDVEGIYTADPHSLESAMLIPKVSYPFMIEASSLGAKVMHDRSVIMGMRYQVPIQVKNSFTTGEGTAIGMKETHSRCIAVDMINREMAKVSVIGDFVDSSPQILGEAVSLFHSAGIEPEGNTMGRMSFSSVMPKTKAAMAAKLLHAHFVEKEYQVAH